jgi:hypothetical protein
MPKPKSGKIVADLTLYNDNGQVKFKGNIWQTSEKNFELWSETEDLLPQPIRVAKSLAICLHTSTTWVDIAINNL